MEGIIMNTTYSQETISKSQKYSRQECETVIREVIKKGDLEVLKYLVEVNDCELYKEFPSNDYDRFSPDSNKSISLDNFGSWDHSESQKNWYAVIFAARY